MGSQSRRICEGRNSIPQMMTGSCAASSISSQASSTSISWPVCASYMMFSFRCGCDSILADVVVVVKRAAPGLEPQCLPVWLGGSVIQPFKDQEHTPIRGLGERSAARSEVDPVGSHSEPVAVTDFHPAILAPDEHKPACIVRDHRMQSTDGGGR